MTRRGVAALGLGLVTALLVFGGLLVVGRVLAVRADLPPAGPTCDYEMDTGSGASGTGLEEVDWVPVPERLCRATTGEGAGGLWPTPHDPGAVTDLAVRWAVSALAAALAGATVTVVVLLRRRPSLAVDGTSRSSSAV